MASEAENFDDIDPAEAAALDELVLYVCGQVERPADLGAAKLHKVFWFSDCALFARRNKALTAAAYVKGAEGPYSPQIEKSLQRLLKSSRLAERKWGAQRQFFATGQADIARFDGEQIALLDATIERVVRNPSAAATDDVSHGRIWEIAEPGEDLPLHLVYAENLQEPSVEDLEWARKSVTPELLAWSEKELRKDR